jgi:hypothetical protein
MSLESDGGMILTGGNRRTRRKTCPSATLSTTNPTWIDPGANPGLRGESPATNDLSRGTASLLKYTQSSKYILKIPLEQLLSDAIFDWKTCILRQGFFKYRLYVKQQPR